MRADAARGQAAQLRIGADRVFDFNFIDRTGAVRVDIDRQRLGNADRIGKLNRAAAGKPGSDDILRQIAGDISGRPVDLGRVLARKRSAAYAARYLAKNVVASGMAAKCTIQLSYAIGVAHPLSIYVDTHGTCADGISDAALEDAIRSIESLGGLTPRAIRTRLQLNRPIYRSSAAYGHFGRTASDGMFPWEQTDLVEELKQALAVPVTA